MDKSESVNTDTVAGLSFIVAGLAMFSQVVLRSTSDLTTVSFVVMGAVLFSIGSIMAFRDR